MLYMRLRLYRDFTNDVGLDYIVIVPTRLGCTVKRFETWGCTVVVLSIPSPV